MMKKILFSILSVASATALFVLSNIKNQQIPLLSDNIEALVSSEGPLTYYFFATRYDISKQRRLVNLSSDISGICLYQLLSDKDLSKLTEAKQKKGISFTIDTVDCHMRKCLLSSEPQIIECPGDQKKWVMCSSYCNHSNNGI